MRLSIRPDSSRVGDVEVHELCHVTELDAGHFVETSKSEALSGGAFNSLVGSRIVPFSHESLHVIETQIAIIIPCMDEEQIILDGVLHGVPHDCLIILVSNSNPSSFEAECRLLEDFCGNAQRPGIVVHQQDAGLASAFLAAGMSELLLEAGPLRIRNGKGEAMIIGAAVSKLAGKQFVGFIDADNFVAGSVHEYCKVFAAGLHYGIHHCNQSAMEPYAMVRIKWNSKPKVRDNKLVFEKSGRSSRVVNEWMNHLLNALVSSNTQNEIIQTGNAGEHAMSLDLAMKLRFATGYAVEPFQLINAWEQFGSCAPIEDQSLTTTVPAPCCTAERDYTTESTRCESVDADEEDDASQAYDSSLASTPATSYPSSPVGSRHSSTASFPRNVQILQVETRNPHFHDTSKGSEHIERMQVQGLSTIYHSRLTPQKLKDELRMYMKEKFPTIVGADGEPDRARVYPSLGTMDFGIFRLVVNAHAGTLRLVGNLTGNLL